MKLQYGILGMVLVSGGAFAHDMDAEGIQVGGYVDARYTWTKDTTNSFSLEEGALYAGKRVGGARVFIDAGFTDLGVLSNTEYGLQINQAYVANAADSGFMWKAGRFDRIFGWYDNDSGHYQLSDDGLLQGGLPATNSGLLLGYNFSDMLALHLLVEMDAVQAGGMARNMDYPKWGVKLDSKMDAFDLGLGFRIEDNGADANQWGLDVVAGTKFADYDFKAIFVMDKNGEADSTMGFGAQVGSSFTDMITGVARVEWAKEGEDDTQLQLTVGPQFNLEKGFLVKADYTFSKAGGDANDGAEAGHTVVVAAVYDF